MQGLKLHEAQSSAIRIAFASYECYLFSIAKTAILLIAMMIPKDLTFKV